MLPTFDKKPGWPLRHSDSAQNWWDLNKTIPIASEFESTFGDRDRGKNGNAKPARQHPRSVTRYDSLPTINEPPDTARTATASVALTEESYLPMGSKTDKVRLCIKRWKKISFSRSHISTSSVHDDFEVSSSLVDNSFYCQPFKTG